MRLTQEEIKKIKAMINSMTKKERENPHLIKESDNLILEPYLSFSDNILFVVSNDIQFSFDVLSRLAEVLEKQLHLEHLKKIDILITVFVKTDQSNVKEELLNNGGSAFVQLFVFENRGGLFEPVILDPSVKVYRVKK